MIETFKKCRYFHPSNFKYCAIKKNYKHSLPFMILDDF